MTQMSKRQLLVPVILLIGILAAGLVLLLKRGLPQNSDIALTDDRIVFELPVYRKTPVLKNTEGFFNPDLWPTTSGSGYTIVMRRQEGNISSIWHATISRDLTEITTPTILQPEVYRKCNDDAHGLEDARLMSGHLMFNTSCHNLCNQKRAMCTMALHDNSMHCFRSERKTEKNWAQIETRPDIVLYSSSPPQILRLKDMRISNGPQFTHARLNNGTKLLSMSYWDLPAGFYVSIAHPATRMPDGKPRYRNVAIVWYIPDVDDAVPTCFGYTERFHCGSNDDIEFVSGLCRDLQNTEGLILGVGVGDNSFLLCCVDISRLFAHLNLVSARAVPPRSEPYPVSDIVHYFVPGISDEENTNIHLRLWHQIARLNHAWCLVCRSECALQHNVKTADMIYTCPPDANLLYIVHHGPHGTCTYTEPARDESIIRDMYAITPTGAALLAAAVQLGSGATYLTYATQSRVVSAYLLNVAGAS